MPTTNLPNLISNLRDLLKVWRKTQNGGIAVREINHLMLRKYGTSINPAAFGFGTLHAFLDYLGKCGHIKLEFEIVKSVEKDDLDKHGAGYESDKFYNDVENKKSDHISSEERDSKTESARFFSEAEDEDVKLRSAAAEYYKAFPDQAQPESHQLLHYRQHGSKGKEEEPRCQEAKIHPSTSKVDDQFIQEKQTVAIAPKPKCLLNTPRSKFEAGRRPQNCVEASKSALHDEKFEKECQPLKEVENKKSLRPPNHPKKNEKIDEDHQHGKFDENYGKASGVPFWVNTRCDYEDDFLKKIKNWQFNPPADEKDEWPTEPRFNPLLHSTVISDNRDNEERPHFTKSKAVFEEEQRKDDLVDLNNNSINKTEATKPQPRRKTNFGPFETSFEEEEESPNLPKCIQWDPFMKPFTNNPLDYFDHRDCIPTISFSRTLRKGDIFELKVVAIENPGSFYIRILGPKELLVEGQHCKSLSGFGAKLSSFYDRFQDEEVLAVKEFSLETGVHVACQYFSKRTGKTEWRRGTVMVKINLGNFKIDLFDHGVIATVHFSMLRKLFKPFGQLPKQAINAKLGGVEPGPLSYDNLWTVQETDYFKRKTAKADKNFVLGMNMKRQESHIDGTLELALVDPSNTKSSKMTNKTLNFQMLKHNLGSVLTDHEKRDEFTDIWDQYDCDMRRKLNEWQDGQNGKNPERKSRN